MSSSIVDFYIQQAETEHSTNPWLAEKQKKALRDFKNRAFPTRTEEDWKYTALDRFLAERFALDVDVDPINPTEVVADNRSDSDIKMPIGREIRLHGKTILIEDADDFYARLPQGVIVESLLTALQQHEDKIKPWLGKILPFEHGFHALNMASLQSGIFIYVPTGVQLAEPLVLAHWQNKQSVATHARHLILLEEGSTACIIESFHGKQDCRYFNNSVTEVHLAARAELTHYKIQAESREAFHVSHLAVHQETASQLHSHSLSLGGQLSRQDLTVRFLAEHAQCVLNGIYLTHNGQHVDHHTSVHHSVPNCTSLQDYKGVLMGKSRAVFNGKVIVGKQAIHTNAQQHNKNLLLSDSAEVDTKPQLEIFADDVSCAHGATVGHLDEDALFYLATRGMDVDEATRFLIQAFAADNLKLIPNDTMKSWMAECINQQLRKNHD